MRWLLAILVIFTIQLKAEAQESVSELSSQLPEQKWGKSQDAFVQQQSPQEKARVKAFIRDLLGEGGPKTPAVPHDSSSVVEGID